jgi:hypothetical protein
MRFLKYLAGIVILVLALALLSCIAPGVAMMIVKAIMSLLLAILVTVATVAILVLGARAVKALWDRSTVRRGQPVANLLKKSMVLPKRRKRT